MRMLFRQRAFSWLDSYDIFDEEGNALFRVEGQFGWGHRLNITDVQGRHLATLREKVLSFLPRFEILIGEQSCGYIHKELTLFHPRFTLECNGWTVTGSFTEWDYTITAPDGSQVAAVSKELLHWTDTYTIDVLRRDDALLALMVVLAIDADKCSRN